MMIYNLIVKDTAKTVITDFAFDYENKEEGLGYRFLQSIEIALNDITVNPLGYQIKYDTFRSKLVKPFPYLLIFEVIKKDVIVYQCYNEKSNPNKLFTKK